MREQRIPLMTLAVLLTAMTSVPAFAAKTTPATDKNSAVPAVPRAIPDLIPYHKFDPPTSSMFDMSKLTISGDIRVRPELRNNIGFTAGQSNSFFVQQWTRLGFHYAVSPDVVFFFQPQYSKNWGSGANSLGGDPNSSDGTLFARQAFMLIRNFAMPGLTVKAGRQMVVWGNHRMFGHFDWNNVGWSFDGVTANYKFNSAVSFQVGWLRVDESNCGAVTSGGCGGPGPSTVTLTDSGGDTVDVSVGSLNTSRGRGNADSDIIYVRAPMKVMGFTVEPTYIWHNGGTNRLLDVTRSNLALPRPGNQSRHTLGGRAVKKMSLMGGTRLDATVEGYYQLGEIGANESVGRELDISAYAFHVDGGVTLPVPMQPRLGGEFNLASGNSGEAGEWGGFDQLYPTNHIHFGYMDRMSWKNMVHYSASLQLRPTKDSHLDVSGHWFALNEEGDHWYGASQAPFMRSASTNTEDDLGQEIDVVYTMFFTPGNHVGWQIGGGVFFPGDYVESGSRVNAAGAAVPAIADASSESWGYTQLWINF